MKHSKATGVRFIFCLAAALFCAAFVYAAGSFAQVSAADQPTLVVSDDTPPVAAARDIGGDYGWRVAADIEVYEDNGEYYLFLPSTADLTAVKLRYTGDRQLYNQDSGELCAGGATTVLNLTGTDTFIYEYDAESNVYTRYNLNVMRGGNIASIYIALDDGDEALRRINTWHNDVETGKITVISPDSGVIFDGDLTRMKGHGLTSYEGSGKLNTKNSYNINIGQKAELIDGAGKSKKWTMLRIRTFGNYDPTGISYPIAFYTYNALVGDKYYNITARFVDVYINGEYRGVYILTERMDINGSIQVTDLESMTVCDSPSFKTISKSNKGDPAIKAGINSYSYCETASLVDESVDITGGYVLEIMCNTYGECGFRTAEGMYVNVKSPAYCTREQMQYIATYVQEFENALFSETGYNELGKHYTDYIEADSFAAQALVYAFYLNWENYRTSTYIYKDVDGSEHDVLTFGPVWDFESGPNVMYDPTLFGTTFAYTEKQQYIWYQQLWKKGGFMQTVSKVNDRMKTVVSVLRGKEGDADIFTLSELIETIGASQDMNWIRWRQPGTFESGAEAMTEAIDYRFDHWFNELWNDKKYLISVSASRSSSGGKTVITADVLGKNDGVYTWYRVSDDLQTLTVIEGVTGAEFTPDSDGLYCFSVSGPNNARWEAAAGRIFRSAKIEMFSNIVDTRAQIDDDTTAETDPAESTGDTGTDAESEPDPPEPDTTEPDSNEANDETAEEPSSPSSVGSYAVYIAIAVVSVASSSSAVILTKKKN